jgi:RimJ/RimL family protein N-acetyltransferase
MSHGSDDSAAAPGGRAAGPGMAGPQLRLPFDVRPIRTARAILRPFAPGDLDDVGAYQAIDSVVRYLAWEPQTADESARYLTERAGMIQLAADGTHNGIAYAVDVGSPSGRASHVVGEIIVLLDSAPHCRLEIGWIFHPDVHGRGYAGEAARAVLDVCFTSVLAHRVIAKLDPRNLASARLSERLGLRHEGVSREDHFLKGEWRSTSVYALLADEYHQRKPG